MNKVQAGVEERLLGAHIAMVRGMGGPERSPGKHQSGGLFQAGGKAWNEHSRNFYEFLTRAEIKMENDTNETSEMGEVLWKKKS